MEELRWSAAQAHSGGLCDVLVYGLVLTHELLCATSVNGH